jgi:hypothetical protein
MSLIRGGSGQSLEEPRRYVVAGASAQAGPGLTADVVRREEAVVRTVMPKSRGFAVMVVAIVERAHPERRVGKDQRG